MLQFGLLTTCIPFVSLVKLILKNLSAVKVYMYIVTERILTISLNVYIYRHHFSLYTAHSWAEGSKIRITVSS